MSALLTVTSDQQPTVCFTQGHGEPDIESLADGGYGTFAEEIRRDAYQTRAVAKLPRRGAAARLHRAGRRRAAAAFTDAEARRWIATWRAGGRLLIMLGPVFNHDASGFAHVGLEALARRWGVGSATTWWSIRRTPATSRGRRSGRPGRQLRAPRDHRPPGRPPDVLAAHAPAGASGAGRARGSVTPLVRTSAEGWGETDLATIRGDADLAFDAGRDRKGPVTVAVAAGERRQDGRARLVVLGTGRLIMNYRLAGVPLRDYDRDFMLSVLAWLADREERSGIAPKDAARVALAPTAAQVAWAFRLFVLGLPLATLAIGAWVWRRRRV